MTLIEYISQFADINDEFQKKLEDVITIEKHPKGKMLLKEGEFCRKVFYVEKGLLRFFYYGDEGKDITHWFLLEQEFITEIDSIYSQKPSEFYLETLEDCVLHTFNPQAFIELSVSYNSLNIFKDIMFVKSITELGEKIKDLQFRDAKTRYHNLIEKYPDILLRVPLGHIAAYLGITQQSLSRIRRQR